MEWYIKVIENYVNFKGRARRKEYWMFTLVNTMIAFVVAYGMTYLGLVWVSTIYQLLVFIPTIAVGVRRVHDTNHSGWFILVPLYNLFLFCSNGDSGPNRFGPDPKVIAVE